MEWSHRAGPRLGYGDDLSGQPSRIIFVPENQEAFSAAPSWLRHRPRGVARRAHLQLDDTAPALLTHAVERRWSRVRKPRARERRRASR